MITKLTFTISFFLFFLNSYSQIDTAIIFSEIRELKTDDMIDEYWRELDSCDQDLNTFTNPVTQTENLVKTIYFFKYFGFNRNNRFKINTISQSNAEMHALYIWMHNRFVDLNSYTFPLISECRKIYLYDGGEINYYLQNVQIDRFEKVEFNNKLSLYFKEKSFEKININNVVSLANEAMKIYSIKDSKKNVNGRWRLVKENLNQYEVQIILIENNYYLHELKGNYYKLKQDDFNNKYFHFSNEIDDTYLEILENGDLVNKDLKGKTLTVYKKISF